MTDPTTRHAAVVAAVVAGDVGGDLSLLAPEQADPITNPCGCVRRHMPLPESNDIHHIWPRGMGGPDVAKNRIALCPTGHDIVHRILADFVKHGELTPVSTRNHHIYQLAKQGYEAWVAAGSPRPTPIPPSTPAP